MLTEDLLKKDAPHLDGLSVCISVA